MAINFPSTAGQPTDGTFTYVAAGITYSWNGESWTAAGSGATATDLTVFSVTTNAVGTAALSYDSNSGVFSYTPPDFSSYLTAEADTLDTVTARGATTNVSLTLSNILNVNSQIHVNSSLRFDHQGGQSTFGNVAGAGGVTVRCGQGRQIDFTNENGTVIFASLSDSSGLTAGGLTYPTTNGNSGEVLTSDGGGNVTWAASGSSLQSRTTAQGTTATIADGVSADITISAAKTYALQKIETSAAAWVTLYSDTGSRTNDASRNESTDPLPGSGVIAEVITTGAATQKITPGTIGWNDDGVPSSNVYLKVVNKSGSSQAITVTLHYVQLEA